MLMDKTLDAFFASAEFRNVITEDSFIAQFGKELPSLEGSKALYTALVKQRQSIVSQIQNNVSEIKNIPKKAFGTETPNFLKSDALALLSTIEKEITFNNSVLLQINEAIEAELQHLSTAAEEIQENSKIMININDEKFEHSLFECENLVR